LRNPADNLVIGDGDNFGLWCKRGADVAVCPHPLGLNIQANPTWSGRFGAQGRIFKMAKSLILQTLIELRGRREMIKFLTASIAATILLVVVVNVLGTETEVMAFLSR
jgi:hypothetical protein